MMPTVEWESRRGKRSGCGEPRASGRAIYFLSTFPLPNEPKRTNSIPSNFAYSRLVMDLECTDRGIDQSGPVGPPLGEARRC